MSMPFTADVLATGRQMDAARPRAPLSPLPPPLAVPRLEPPAPRAPPAPPPPLAWLLPADAVAGTSLLASLE